MERKAASEEGYVALRAQEERDDVPREAMVFVYDDKVRYSEIHSRIESDEPSLKAKCGGSCNAYYMPETELKKLPCGRAIHDLCFKNIYSSTGCKGFQCAVCEKKFKVFVWPKL